VTERGRIKSLEESGNVLPQAAGQSSGATGQFDIADERDPAEVAALIRRLGYEPVWKDWDAALSA